MQSMGYNTARFIKKINTGTTAESNAKIYVINESSSSSTKSGTYILSRSVITA
jgi:hypothetical protein